MPSRVPPGTYAIAITVLAVAIASVAAWRERPTDAASHRGLGDAIDATAKTVAARKRIATPVASAPTAPSASPTIDEPSFDRQGRLLPDPTLRRYLDRHLTAVDAQAVATQRQGLARDLVAMPAAQAGQILAWFDRYAAYLQAEAADAPHRIDQEQQVQQTRALRERLLGPQAASTLFADETATR
ncbi:Lipase chaperone [Xanthomonas sp. SS]|uniref:hypothetical protein n=1 Tax=Xanthomonas sp. SS TaxID=2724122 RepID=UPI00163997B6|nr:hypothetical protein [Xanthomonas sp. SS]QNH17630.1 Lipase chaperone [Xanthomonas sp. SS]